MRRVIPFLTLLLPTVATALEVSAKSAIIMDADTGKVLWSKDPDTKRYPASTTKIMTALLLIERCLPSEVITAPKDVQKVTGASLHLKPGEKVAAGEMLYALMLRSANDGCYAVARHIGGSVAGFAKLMNERARAIGCTNTEFHNPHGLNNDKHVTTARDLALITREAIKYETFNRVAATHKHTIKRSINKDDILLISKNKSLKHDPTADGIKTGYTNPAGQCFVGSATRDGYRLITVVLRSEGWHDDNKAMLDWAFENHERRLVARAGEPLTQAEVRGGEAAQVPLVAEKDVYVVVRKGTAAVPPKMRLEGPEALDAPVSRGQRVGHVLVADGSGFEQRVAVMAAEDVGAARTMLGVGQSLSRSHLMFALFLGACGYYVRKRARRMRLSF
ncbi:MAG TPA: D-alanyl-D-alanine carboxypeptidase family protein [Fimbriimonadaceae bacterium]|nr:D-alanyl-D-alanine carboxypeptidase family protein [Fimbriimonadaceae bacterium]